MEPTKSTATENLNVVAAGLAAAPQGEVIRLLEELSMATINLQDQTHNLSDALKPVLRNEPLSDGMGKDQREPNTDLGSMVQMIINRVNATNHVVVDARSRLEL